MGGILINKTSWLKYIFAKLCDTLSTSVTRVTFPVAVVHHIQFWLKRNFKTQLVYKLLSVCQFLPFCPFLLKRVNLLNEGVRKNNYGNTLLMTGLNTGVIMSCRAHRREVFKWKRSPVFPASVLIRPFTQGLWVVLLLAGLRRT